MSFLVDDREPVLPCKFCKHKAEAHFVYEDSHGWWEYLEDVGHEVWREEPEPRPVCGKCESDCIFDEMTNLEYLEWKSDNDQCK